MNSLRGRIRDRKRLQNTLLQLQTLICSSSTASNIKIPNRIERGPTDILRAIESTISRDPTAVHYKYQDDPFLMPASNYGKRTFALSMESGRKAAMWIRQQHADLFQHRVADPIIPSFLPKPIYTDKSEVSEEILLNVLKGGQVEDAFQIYQLLEKDVKSEAKQALLEALCFCNSLQPLDTDLMEQRWFQNINQDKQTWNENKEIEDLFSDLIKQDDKTAAAAYNAMICGLAKYMKKDRAWLLYEQCQEKGVPLHVRTYNFLIQTINLKVHIGSERLKLMKKLLTEMSEKGIQPNVQTMNSCIKVLSAFHEDAMALDVIQSLLKEFDDLGIKPCLTTYYYILVTLTKKGKVADRALCEIMSELEKTEQLEIQDMKDTFFFSLAMNVAKDNFNLPLGERIHEFLLSKNNYKFIGDNFKESIYYRNYTLLQLLTKPIEEFAEVYTKMVPYIYIPEPSVIYEILQTIKGNPPENVQNFLPLIWSHIFMFDHVERQNITNLLFSLMADHCALPADSPLNKEYAHVAWSYCNVLSERLSKKAKLISLSGETLGRVLVLLLRNDQFDDVQTVLSLMNEWQRNMDSAIKLEQLNEIFQGCITRANATIAIDIVQYAVDCGYAEAGLMARQIKDVLPLNNKEENRLISLMGKEILEVELPEPLLKS